MMAFFFSHVAGLMLGLILIGVLICTGLKSAARSLETVDHTKTMTWKEFKKEAGPMTWQERIVTVIQIALFVALVVWIASIT